MTNIRQFVRMRLARLPGTTRYDHAKFAIARMLLPAHDPVAVDAVLVSNMLTSRGYASALWATLRFRWAKRT